MSTSGRTGAERAGSSAQKFAFPDAWYRTQISTSGLDASRAQPRVTRCVLTDAWYRTPIHSAD
jgi:hypothetical protein